MATCTDSALIIVHKQPYPRQSICSEQHLAEQRCSLADLLVGEVFSVQAVRIGMMQKKQNVRIFLRRYSLRIFMFFPFERTIHFFSPSAPTDLFPPVSETSPPRCELLPRRCLTQELPLDAACEGTVDRTTLPRCLVNLTPVPPTEWKQGNNCR